MKKRGVPSLEILSLIANREKWEEDIALLSMGEKMRIMYIFGEERASYRLLQVYHMENRRASITSLMYRMLSVLIESYGIERFGTLITSKDIGKLIYVVGFVNGVKIFICHQSGYHYIDATIIPYPDEYTRLFDDKNTCETYEYYVNVLVPAVEKMANLILNGIK